MELMAIVRAVHMAAAVLVTGAFAFRLFVLPEGESQPIAPWLHRATGWGIALSILSWLAWLALVASGISGQPVAQLLTGDMLQTVLARTAFGQTWITRFVLLLLLAFSLLRPGPSGRAREAMEAALAVSALVSIAWTGHALASGGWHVAADALHLLGAGIWLGALPPLLLVIARARRAPDSHLLALAARVTRRFSRLGIAGVSLLLLTGLANAWFLVGSFAAMDTPYGRLLAAKLVLVVVILALAAVNRWELTPRLANPHSTAVKLLVRNVIAELVLGACILGLAGVLGLSGPPREHAPVHRMQHSAAHGGPVLTAGADAILDRIEQESPRFYPLRRELIFKADSFSSANAGLRSIPQPSTWPDGSQSALSAFRSRSSLPSSRRCSWTFLMCSSSRTSTSPQSAVGDSASLSSRRISARPIPSARQR